MKALVILGLASVVQAASAKCAMFPGADVTSSSGKYRVVVAKYDITRSEQYYFEIRAKGRSGSWKKVASGSVPMQGHHGEFHISNDGSRFVLIDRYEGAWVYSDTGKELAHWSGDAIVNIAKEVRVGKWACHPTGAWQSGRSLQVGEGVHAVVGQGTGMTIRFHASLQSDSCASNAPLVLIAALAIGAVWLRKY